MITVLLATQQRQNFLVGRGFQINALLIQIRLQRLKVCRLVTQRCVFLLDGIARIACRFLTQCIDQQVRGHIFAGNAWEITALPRSHRRLIDRLATRARQTITADLAHVSIERSQFAACIVQATSIAQVLGQRLAKHIGRLRNVSGTQTAKHQRQVVALNAPDLLRHLAANGQRVSRHHFLDGLPGLLR